MIEMRWLVRPGTGVHREQVLQYRQMIDVTIRPALAGMFDSKGIAETANYQWSEWRDVPVVQESSVN